MSETSAKPLSEARSPAPASRPRLVIAIDPGASGAIAGYITTYSPPGDPSWEVQKLSETPQDQLAQLIGWSTLARGLETQPVAVLEDVGGYVGKAQPGSRMFTFGRGYGLLEGFLISLKFQIVRVRPQKWQSELSLKTRKGESKAEHKRRMRERALELFPQLKPTLDTCDALLILYWHLR